MSLAVELSGVAFGYRPGQRVLEDVELELGEGEFVAVAGPTDVGKTTLVRIMLGLERPGEGTALLFSGAGPSLLPSSLPWLPRPAVGGGRRRAGDGAGGRLGGAAGDREAGSRGSDTTIASSSPRPSVGWG